MFYYSPCTLDDFRHDELLFYLLVKYPEAPQHLLLLTLAGGCVLVDFLINLKKSNKPLEHSEQP